MFDQFFFFLGGGGGAGVNAIHWDLGSCRIFAVYVINPLEGFHALPFQEQQKASKSTFFYSLYFNLALQ